MNKISSPQEFVRVSQMLHGLTVSLPITLMTRERIDEIELHAANDPTLAALNQELGRFLRSVTMPECYTEMAQAYEAYSEAMFYIELKKRGISLQRTTGTGKYGSKRPDFAHIHKSGGALYFEVKALEIVDAMVRHKEIAQEGLEKAADLDFRARTPGIHFGEPQEFSGHLAEATTAERIDATIAKLRNNVKRGQVRYGPTVLVVDLGRLSCVPQGPSGLLPVFFHDEPPAESCVSGELWQIALGLPGEQIFVLPEFDGASNLGGHQQQLGILREYPELVGIMFMMQRWSEPPELLTIWNKRWNQSDLLNDCKLSEHQIQGILHAGSDGLNDASNKDGWPYRVTPLR